MVEQKKSDEQDCKEKRHALYVVLAGLIVVGLVALGAASKWALASDVTAVVTAVGSIVGSIVGAFFGVELGASGKKDSDREAAQARRQATALALVVPPTQIEQVRAVLQALG